MVKTCSKCKEVKQLSEFYYIKYRDCFAAHCKSCNRKYQNDYRNKNKEWLKEQNKKQYLKDPDSNKRRAKEWQEKNQDRYRTVKKEYWINNKEEKIQYDQKYYQENKQRISERIRKYNKDNPPNPIRLAKNRHSRRARLLSNGVYHISDKFLYKLYSSCCVNCGTHNNISADHIVPIVRGGSQSEGNLQPLCRSCNSSKGSKTMMEWKLFLQKSAV